MRHPNITASGIAEITLLSESRVWTIHANFRKAGLAGLEDRRGGRYRQNLTLAQETELLAPFEQESQSGSIRQPLLTSFHPLFANRTHLLAFARNAHTITSMNISRKSQHARTFDKNRTKAG